MPEIDAHLRHFDDAWSHSWESLCEVLEGVGDDEAFHQAPCYAAEAREDGWPAPGSVAWQVAHLAYYKRYYADTVRAAGSDTDPEPRPWQPCTTFAALREVLAAAHAEQRAAIAALTDERLDEPTGGSVTLREFLVTTMRHDVWHAGQIAVARRLYRTRSAPGASAAGAAVTSN